MNMLSTTNSEYECYGDFYDQTSDNKDLLASLTSTAQLHSLTLDSIADHVPPDLMGFGDMNNGPNAMNQYINSKYTNNDYIDSKLDQLMMMNLIGWETESETKDHAIASPAVFSTLPSELTDNGSRYWDKKPPDQWTTEDVWHWMFCWASDKNIDVSEIHRLAYTNMSGHQLCQMSRNDYLQISDKYGSIIYDDIQSLIDQFRPAEPLTPTSSTASADFNFYPNLPSFESLRSSCLNLDIQGSSPSSGSESDRESTSSSMTTVNERQMNGYVTVSMSMPMSIPSTVVQSPMLHHQTHSHVHQMLDAQTLSQKVSMGIPINGANALSATNTGVPQKKAGRRGRPPKKDAKSRSRQGKGNGKLWEFIRDLLLDPVTNPSFIRWERREDGIFKFIQSDKVAKLWGQRKQNPRMTYEKLSRAMRYYYKSQVLLPVFGRRLVYKFGPNATGWRPCPGGF